MPKAESLAASCARGKSGSLRKRPASFGHVVKRCMSSEEPGEKADRIVTREDLIQMGPAAVREILESQGRYSRKRHREQAYAVSTGQENKIRIWADLLNISRGKEVACPADRNKFVWWHKSKRELIDDIVSAVSRYSQ